MVLFLSCGCRSPFCTGPPRFPNLLTLTQPTSSRWGDLPQAGGSTYRLSVLGPPEQSPTDWMDENNRNEFSWNCGGQNLKSAWNLEALGEGPSCLSSWWPQALLACDNITPVLASLCTWRFPLYASDLSLFTLKPTHWIYGLPSIQDNLVLRPFT